MLINNLDVYVWRSCCFFFRQCDWYCAFWVLGWCKFYQRNLLSSMPFQPLIRNLLLFRLNTFSSYLMRAPWCFLLSEWRYNFRAEFKEVWTLWNLSGLANLDLVINRFMGKISFIQQQLASSNLLFVAAGALGCCGRGETKQMSLLRLGESRT